MNRLPGDSSSFLIAGTGPIAFMMAFVLRHEHPSSLIEVRGRRPERLEVLSDSGFLVRALDEVAEKGVFDSVIDTTGSPQLCSELVGCVARGGTLQLFAGMARDASVVLPAFSVHYEEVNVIGSFHYRPSEARQALELLQAGVIPVEKAVTVFRPLAEYREAFREVTAGAVLKTALLP